jgi:tetratricopeptide (TPR) repeat protein
MLLPWWGYAQSYPSDSIESKLRVHPAHDTVRVQLLNQLSFANYYSNPIKSLQYAFEARNISDSLGYSKGEAEAYRQIGLSYWAQGDMSTALNYYLTGLRVAQEHKHLQQEADITSNIGTAYNGLGDYTEALKLLNRALAMQRKLKNEWRAAAVLNNIGDAYLANKNYDSAKYAYLYGLKISEKGNYALGVSTNIRNLGNVLEARGLYDSALVSYFRCADLSQKIGDTRGIILSHKSIASVYLKTKKFQQAKKFADVALQAGLKGKLKVYIRDAYEVLAKTSEAEGDQKKAFEYFKKFVAYKDTVQNLKVLSEANAQRFRFETEKKLTEIQLLTKESEIQASQVALKNNQLLMVSILVIVSFLLLAVVVRSYQRQKGRNELLQQKNTEIENQRRELAEHRDELTALNEELVSQQEELHYKNSEIEAMNQRIMETNHNLEAKVAERTKVLEEQYHRLAEYAHFNAHKLRAPVASILGLVTLLQREGGEAEMKELIEHLKKSTENLDQVVKTINSKLEEGLDVYEPKSEPKS